MKLKPSYDIFFGELREWFWCLNIHRTSEEVLISIYSLGVGKNEAKKKGWLGVLKSILWMAGSFLRKLTCEKFKVLSNRKLLKIDSIDYLSVHLHVYFGTAAYWHLSTTTKIFKFTGSLLSLYWLIYKQDFYLLKHCRVKLSVATRWGAIKSGWLQKSEAGSINIAQQKGSYYCAGQRGCCK